MKKVSLFMIATFVAASSMFVSCGEDPIDPVDEIPTIDVKATYASENAKIISDGDEIKAAEGTVVTFDISFNMGADRLQNVKLTSIIGTDENIVVDSVLNEGIFNIGDKTFPYKYVTNIGKENEKLIFTTFDTKGREGTFTLTLAGETPTPQGNYIITTQTLMGGQKNTTHGSFYTVALGKVYNVKTAKANPGDVDFAYYYDDLTKSATIAAPADEGAKKIEYVRGDGGTMKTWTNSTKFLLVSDADGSKPDTWWSETEKITDDTPTNVDQLSTNDVVVFKTAKGTLAAFVVDAVAAGVNGSITIRLIERIAAE